MRRELATQLKTTARWVNYLRSHPLLAGLVGVTVVSLLLLIPLWQELQARDIVASFSYTDFWVYYSTAGDWLAGDVIYPDLDDPFGNYLYGPIYLIPFVPFREIGTWPLVAEIWITLSISVLWLSLQALLWTYVPSLSILERLLLAPITFILLIGFHPVFYGMRLGQISVILAAIVTLAVVAMERSRQGNQVMAGISGALTAIGGTVKVFYAPVGAHLLVNPIRLLGAAITGIILVSASLLIFGVSVHLDYLQVLAWGEDWGAEPAHPSWGWIPGYYRPLYFLGQSVIPLPFLDFDLPVSLLVRLAIIAGIIALSFWLFGKDADREVFAIGILAIPLVGPQVAVHDLAVVLPAIVLLAVIEINRDGHPWLPLAGLLLFHWQAYATYALANAPEWVPLSNWIIHYSPWLQPALFANGLLLGLAVYRALEYRPPDWFINLEEFVREISNNR